MEDTWFIYFENDWLYFHRSWTGHGIFKTHFTKNEEQYKIEGFWVERNAEKYKNEDDTFDIDTFSFLITRALLKIDSRNFLAAHHSNPDKENIKIWSNLGNLLRANKGLDYTQNFKSVLFGLAVGDALGVPVEFSSRTQLNN